MPGLRDNPIGRSLTMAHASLAQAQRYLTDAKEGATANQLDPIIAAVAKLRQAANAPPQQSPIIAEPTGRPAKRRPIPPPQTA